MSRRGASVRGAPDWDRDGDDWPHRDHSDFVRASAIRWHVQRMGQGPTLLAVHGLGASTHSFRGLAPALSERFSVFSVDLPGHGFTEAPAVSRMTLPGIANALAELLESEGISPAVVVGHSVGAAILCRMALAHQIAPRLIVSINGALRPFQGPMAGIYEGAARLIAVFSPFAASMAARLAGDPDAIRQLIEQTGSRVDEEGLRLYQRLVLRSGHTEAAMAMMARWNLVSLESDLDRLPCDLLLIAGARDTAVPPAHALHLAGRLRGARAVVMPDVGHLSHEEAPRRTAEIIIAAATEAGETALPPPPTD